MQQSDEPNKRSEEARSRGPSRVHGGGPLAYEGGRRGSTPQKTVGHARAGTPIVRLAPSLAHARYYSELRRLHLPSMRDEVECRVMVVEMVWRCCGLRVASGVKLE